MERLFEILDLLNQRDYYMSKLNNLEYGAVEVRYNNKNKYIYTHYKIGEDTKTKYNGEYTEELYNQLVEKNNQSKKIKKELRRINNRLDDLGYEKKELSEDVKWNIDLAKRELPNTVYKQAILEGVNTTFVKTDEIIQNGRVKNMNVSDVYVIVNLKHAWQFILDEYVITAPTDYSILCAINKYVESGFSFNAGKIRNVPVSIGGTSWVPDFPFEADIKDDINNIVNKKKSDIDISIDLLLYVSRKQMFIDGNKRCAVIFANHYLISKGKGLIVVPDDKVKTYRKLLLYFYETNDDKEIREFLKNYCYTKLKES